MRQGWRNRFIGSITAATAAMLICAPIAAGQTEGEAMRAMVTETRDDYGVSTLGTHWALKELAKRQAKRMRDARTIFHNDRIVDELNAMTREWTHVGENVGMGPNVTKIENAFMRSRTHKANIVSMRWNAMAISVAKDADGKRYVAQIFARMT